MGTSYHIHASTSDKQTWQALQASIDARLADINKSMSTYDDSSLISKFNRAPAGACVTVDDDFLKVMADARAVYEASGGAFDPTVMPLVSLWGFGKAMSVERLSAPPTPDEIAAARVGVGFDKVRVDGNQVCKAQAEVGLDFSAIAKGYAVDVIGQVLAEYGSVHYMVEIGGEVLTRGVNAAGEPWRIAIDAPVIDSTVTDRKILTTLALPDMHLATSGNYRNSIEYNGKRYSHTINPNTAAPVADGAPSVTVLHDSVMLADGWATALTALPESDARQMAEDARIMALFVHQDSNGKWQMHNSTALEAHLNAQTAK